jgi:hypothetical protein
LRIPNAADPRDGVRLIKAFLAIKEPAWREKLIRLAEDLAKASSDCLGTAQAEENHKAHPVVSAFLRTVAEDDAPVPTEMP